MFLLVDGKYPQIRGRACLILSIVTSSIRKINEFVEDMIWFLKRWDKVKHSSHK
jgi:hypothetical protein